MHNLKSLSAGSLWTVALLAGRISHLIHNAMIILDFNYVVAHILCYALFHSFLPRLTRLSHMIKASCCYPMPRSSTTPCTRWWPTPCWGRWGWWARQCATPPAPTRCGARPPASASTRTPSYRASDTRRRTSNTWDWTMWLLELNKYQHFSVLHNWGKQIDIYRVEVGGMIFTLNCEWLSESIWSRKKLEVCGREQ